MSKGTVFVGLSGGVDSSVAALRLKHEGYAVVGVFIKVWHPEWLTCNWEAERLDAMRVAAKLEIPFLTCDAEAAYRDSVAQYFIAEYQAGRTPNPDVLCNKAVKFGAFYEFARAHGADFIATGHYAQKVTTPEGFALGRGNDPEKDQSYFLWMIPKEVLPQVLFPVGDTPKASIRKEAEAAGLPTSQKKDSQGICFLGHIDIKEFLSHYITLTPGEVVTEGGEVIGQHEGAFIYTVGQRHGFTITTKDSTRTPYYVLRKEVESNRLIVGTEKPVLAQESTLTLCHTNWFARGVEVGETIELQTRYRQPPVTAVVQSVDTDCVVVVPQTTLEAVAAGQSCVCYRGNTCIGGGIIVA